MPGCGNPSAHAHHLWPRSHLRGQPYEWVELPDGTVVGNRIGLCFTHHEWVTGPLGGYKARIRYSSGLFWYEVRASEEVWNPLLLLDPQPPGVPTAPAGIPATPDDVCPACGHTKRRRANTPRRTKEWTLSVPDDAEQGAEVLDDWADEIATLLGFGDESSRLRRYHAVATALAWTVQNRQDFVSDLVAAR